MTDITRRALAFGAVSFAALPAAAAPSSRLIDPVWRMTGTGRDPDYRPWAAFLSKWRRLGADGIARVDYAAARADAGAINAWLSAMQQVDPTTLSSGAAMAFWINLYNGLTVALILDAWPVSTIREVDGGLFNTGPWDEERLTVNGVRLSLDDVEHGILRPVWNDARVHYAVNCASIGCPNLAAAPWTETGLDAALDAAASDYVNHPRGARVVDGRLIVSSIYDWFEEDFGGSEAGVIAHLRKHATGDLATALQDISAIAANDYDWSVNAA